MALLNVNGIKKTYDTGEVALKGVDLSVNAQEIVAVLGLSGSGKSTLLRCINRLVEPDEGTVTLDGAEVTRRNGKKLQAMRQNMGMIFQEFNLVERLTVLENVLSGCLGFTSMWRCITRAFRSKDIDRALEVCERVGIIDHILKRADQLSGGQRQRVGIARALMQNPKILLADEPISSLDPKISIEVMELMISIAIEQQIPILVSVHDLRIAKRFSNRIIGLRKGVKICDVDTAMIDDDLLHEIYDLVSEAKEFALND